MRPAAFVVKSLTPAAESIVGSDSQATFILPQWRTKKTAAGFCGIGWSTGEDENTPSLPGMRSRPPHI
jgi:hypothetical protein